MTLFQLILLAVIQGITEWLPISSSGHLIWVPDVLGMPDQGPLVDAMAHLGTAGALVAYFHRDVVRLVRGGFDVVLGRDVDGVRTRVTPDAKLFLFIALATPPGLAFGITFAMTDLKEILRNPAIIVGTLAGFGILLGVADLVGKRDRRLDVMRWQDAAIVGLAQALAFIPGTSRSGITMTAGRFLGFERDEAARFGMLAGLPLFIAAGGYATLQLMTHGANAVAADGALIPVTAADALVVLAFSFVAGWAAIWFLMKFVVRIGFLPFVIYRLAIAAFLLWWLTQGQAAA